MVSLAVSATTRTRARQATRVYRASHIVQISHRSLSRDSRIGEIRTTSNNDDFAAEVGQLSIRIERFRHGGELRMGPKSLLVR